MIHGLLLMVLFTTGCFNWSGLGNLDKVSDASDNQPADASDNQLGDGAVDLGSDQATDLFTPTVDLSAGDLKMPDLLDLGPPPVCQSVTVTTLAGNGTAGFVDGSGGATGTTEFKQPFGAAVDSAENLYIADSGNNSIRKVAANGTTTTLAGNGTAGFVDGSGGVSGTARFSGPRYLAVDSAGNVYVSDSSNQRIRKVAQNGSTTTLAGNGTQGFFDGTGGSVGTTEFNAPQGIAVDGAGNVYVADEDNCRIRKVAPNGSTVTFAGSGTPGFMDGQASTAQFAYPYGLAIDASGNLYVADRNNNRIRKVAPNGDTTTLSGTGTAGFADGPGGAAQFNTPFGVAADSTSGSIYVADGSNQRIRRVASDGTTTTIAGQGTQDFLDGIGCVARFSTPSGLALTGQSLFVVEFGDQRVRQIQLP